MRVKLQSRVREGDFIELTEDVKSLYGERISKGTVCEVIEVDINEIMVETLDDNLINLDKKSKKYKKV